MEKAIKAVLVLNGVPFGRTHDLVELGYRAEEAVSDLPFAIDRLIRLNPYAVAFRYGEPAVDLLEPEEAEEVVASVMDWADARIRGMADRLTGAGRAATYGLASDVAVQPDTQDTNPTLSRQLRRRPIRLSGPPPGKKIERQRAHTWYR